VGADVEERPVQVGDNVRPGVDQDLVAPLEGGATEVVRRQVARLQGGACGAVVHDDALARGLEIGVHAAHKATCEVWLGSPTDAVSRRFDAHAEFVVPGQSRLSALLDVARTAVRKAERRALVAAAAGSHVVPYLNRLSDLLWTMARWQEGQFMPARERK